MDWETLLTREAGEAPLDWFTRIGTRLLNGAALHVGREPHRLVEIEFYYYSEDHPDAFAHRDAIQLLRGRWYFHRTRGTYRGGSFKGIDLAFGDGTAHAGVLFRGLEASDGTLTDGPSLLVDSLLDKTGAESVAQLDGAIGEQLAWEERNPLRLEWLGDVSDRPIYTCARVGLSLKKAAESKGMPDYIVNRYRFMTEPRRTAKGKPHLVLSLIADGVEPEEITKLTGCPLASVKRYKADYDGGREETKVEPYIGVDLGTKELCRLHGLIHARSS